MSDKEITQEQDMTSKPDDEREERPNEGDPEEDPTLSEEERLARRRVATRPMSDWQQLLLALQEIV